MATPYCLANQKIRHLFNLEKKRLGYCGSYFSLPFTLLQLRLRHDDNSCVFTVNVIQARNLLPKDINGLSDPFVKIYLLPGRK